MISTIWNLIHSILKEFLGLNGQSDPDVKFFAGINLIKSNYFDIASVTKQLKYLHQNSLLIFLNKYFETLKNLFAELSFESKIICIIETWCHPNSDKDNFYNLTNLTRIYLMRKHGRAGGICMFIHGPLIFKLPSDLSMYDESIEALCVKIINKK